MLKNLTPGTLVLYPCCGEDYMAKVVSVDYSRDHAVLLIRSIEKEKRDKRKDSLVYLSYSDEIESTISELKPFIPSFLQKTKKKSKR